MNINTDKLPIQDNYKGTFLKVFCIISALFLASNTLHAAVWLVDPSITISQRYNDNYFLSSNSSQEDEVSTTTITGELALRGKSERADIEALLRLDKANYSGDDSDRDLEDEDNQLLGLSSAYKVSEKNKVKLNAQIFRDTLLRTAEVFLNPEDVFNDDEVSIDPDNSDVDSNLVNVNVRRTRINIKPSWSHSFSERTNGGLNFSYTDVSYSNDRGTNVQEYDRQSIGGQLSHKVSERTKITERISASFFRPDDDNDTDTYEARVGLIHSYNETLKFDFTVGGRYSEFDFNSVNSNSNDSGFVANVGATKLGERTKYRVNLERSVNPSGSGNQVETDRLTASISHTISPKLNFNLRARAFSTESTSNSNSSSDRDLISIEPGLSWQFLKSWNASVSYTYRELDRDNDPNGSADSNSAFISIGYYPPRQF